MHWILLMALGLFLMALVLWIVGRRGGWWVFGVVCLYVFASRGCYEEPRLKPGYPRPTGTSLEEQFRQRQWDEIERDLNP